MAGKKEGSGKLQRVFRSWNGILVDLLTVERMQDGEESVNDTMFLVDSKALLVAVLRNEWRDKGRNRYQFSAIAG